MNSFPSIRPPSFPLDEEIYKPILKSEFEAGYVASRPRATVAKLRWTLRWKALSSTDWSSLDSFFRANIGDVFFWTHPSTSTTYQVRFVDGSLRSTYLVRNLRSVELSIEQAP